MAIGGGILLGLGYGFLFLLSIGSTAVGFFYFFTHRLAPERLGFVILGMLYPLAMLIPLLLRVITLDGMLLLNIIGFLVQVFSWTTLFLPSNENSVR